MLKSILIFKQVIMYKIVTFGEIMLRLATPDYARFGQKDTLTATYGGGEVNVAVSLANYGMKPVFLTRLPENEIADACVRELKGFGVDTSFIVRGGERMGIYFLERGAVNRASKVVYDRSHSAFADMEEDMIDWDMVFKDVSWFHWSGITPAVSEKAALVCERAIKEANKRKIFVSTDLNYRKNLWKYGKTAKEVMPGLVKNCDLIMGNEEDSAMTLGIEPENVDVTKGKLSIDAYEELSKRIMDEYPKCSIVATTLRSSVNANINNWSGILYDGKTMYKSVNYEITDIVDRVGGGDSFMGGLIYGLLNYVDDKQKALDFAVAASALKHTIYGDFNRVTVSEVEKLMAGDTSGRVSR